MNTDNRIPNTDHRIPITEYRSPNTDHRTLISEGSLVKVCCPFLTFGKEEFGIVYRRIDRNGQPRQYLVHLSGRENAAPFHPSKIVEAL